MDDHEPAEAYLGLLKACLTRRIAPEKYKELRAPRYLDRDSTLRRRLFWRRVLPPLRRVLGRYGLELVERVSVPDEERELGHDWPAEAVTMIGMRRLDNLHQCVRDVLQKGIPGDLIETGVWRGGATIFMRGALRAYGDTTRTVWVADSFEGLPKPSAAFAADRDASYWRDAHWLAVSLEEVQENFRRYSLLDDRVRFLKGWFKDTLPAAGIDRLAVMRLDGDMYESTMDALVPLYPRLSSGGYCIIDDYALPACRAAVDDFRAREHITEPIQPIDHWGAFWQKA